MDSGPGVTLLLVSLSYLAFLLPFVVGFARDMEAAAVSGGADIRG